MSLFQNEQQNEQLHTKFDGMNQLENKKIYPPFVTQWKWHRIHWIFDRFPKLLGSRTTILIRNFAAKYERKQPIGILAEI